MNRRNKDTLERRRLEEMYRDGRLRDFAERPERGWIREIRVETLRRAADALDCNLVYALVPKISLESTLRTRARVLAVRDLADSDPAIDPDVLDQRIEHTAGRLLAGGGLWDGRDEQ